MIDLNLKEYATERQAQYIAAVNEAGSYNGGAKLLEVDRKQLTKGIKAVKKKAAAAGYSPEHDFTHPTAPGFGIKRVSTNYNEDGQINQQWVIQEADKAAAFEAVIAAIESACSGIKPVKVIPTPKAQLKDLLTLYTLTDFHLGMYAWAAETGDDWDMEIAENTFTKAVSQMMAGSPDSETAILNLQGDFLHWDGMLALTPESKHVLDADTRFGRLIDIAYRMIINAVQLLAQKHKTVKLLICDGNHDPTASKWLPRSMKYIFEKNKRIVVDDTEFPYYAHLHGKIMLGFHHGHKMKNKALPGLFSSEPRFREMWGQALYTYIHTGHYHQAEQDMAEHGGAIVERHATLASRDAYAARGGWVSWRAAKAITYHKEHGEQSRAVVVP